MKSPTLYYLASSHSRCSTLSIQEIKPQALKDQYLSQIILHASVHQLFTVSPMNNAENSCTLENSRGDWLIISLSLNVRFLLSSSERIQQ